jgi:hypothetical protein
MIIECPNCESKVDAKELAKKTYSGGDYGDPGAFYFLECPACHGVLLGQSDVVQIGDNEWDYERPTRLWPSPKEDTYLHYAIPPLVKKSLEEANRCLQARAYAACAVMSGRAIEAICAEQKTKAKNLAGGLKELKDKGVIDGRLFDWGDALRERRNIGAHATEEDISKDDARDVMDFAIAICEYVFVLADRYEEFKARQAKTKKANKP